MAGKTLSLSRKRRVMRATLDELYRHATAMYLEEQTKPKAQRRSARKICNFVSATHRAKTGEEFRLTHSTILRHAKGGRSCAKYHEGLHATLPEEDAQLVAYVMELADRGFPLSFKRLKEHAEDILRLRLGDEFEPLGKNWAERWAEAHQDDISCYWSRTLDSKRGKAVNPTNNAEWWAMYKKIVAEHDIVAENIYTADETGFTTGLPGRERVMGGKGKKVQHQQRGGGRETITVLVNVSATGVSLPPLVVMKGQSFLVSWKQDDPLNALRGYSKKGWIDGELTEQYAAHFDKQTCGVAAGHARLLIVDGHASHYSRGFLEYMRQQNIHVICYPSHTTHILQALNVALFGPLKAAFVEERDRYERDNQEPASRFNFLKIYGAAHVRALTPEKIRHALERAGTWPINEHVVTPQMLATSRDSSWSAHMPLVPPTPVRIVARMLHITNPARYDSPDSPESPTHRSAFNSEQQTHSSQPATAAQVQPADVPVIPGCGPTTRSQRAARNLAAQMATGDNVPAACTEAVGGGCEREEEEEQRAPETPTTLCAALHSTSLSYLVEERQITSEMSPPRPIASLPAPWKPAQHILAVVPQNSTEALLLQELKATAQALAHARASAVTSHATMALQARYVEQVKGQLGAEERKRQKVKSGARLMGDGRPRVLTSDAFNQEVVAHEEAMLAAAAARETRKGARVAHKLAMAAWEQAEAARKAHNEQLLAAYSAELLEWQGMRDRERQQKRRGGSTKPTRPTLEKQARKPLLKDITGAAEEVGEDFSDAFNAIREEGESGEDEEEG